MLQRYRYPPLTRSPLIVIGIGARLQRARLDYNLRQFLDEQWHPIRLGNNLLNECVRQLFPRHLLDQLVRLPPAQSVEAERRNLATAGPRRAIFWPVRYDKDDPSTITPAQAAGDRPNRGWINPVRILQYPQHRL